nr:unnamed protein product [Callosobruchus analis]
MYNKTTQLVDANFSVPFDIDENLKLQMKYSRIDKKLIAVAVIERDLCHELPKYFVDFLYDLERKAGIPVGVCPIRMITGPASLKILSANRCKAYEDGDPTATFRLHMYNKTTQLFDANFSVPFDLDENVKGNYTLKNVYVDLNKFNVKILLEGSFYVRIVLWKGARTVGCMEFEIQLSPK